MGQVTESVTDGYVAPVVALVAAAVSLGGLLVWWTYLGRKRLIQDMPTSATTAVALGLNELAGRAECADAEYAPQSSTPCVWWQNTFYVSDGEGGWRKTGDRQGGPIQFDLVDDEGSIPVRPRKAEVTGTKVYDGPVVDSGYGRDPNPSLVSRYIEQRSASTKERKVVEHVVAPGDEVYVLGTAQLPYESLDVYIGPDRETGTNPFMIRVGAEQDALWVERVGTVVGALVAISAAAASGVAVADGDALAADRIGWSEIGYRMPVAFVAVVLALMLVAGIVFSYNALRRLRERADAAWSLIDVQLRRRHDLLPNLVAVVQAHATHERTVQTALAELRSKVVADLPSRPTDEAVERAGQAIRAEEAALDRMLALIEAYPPITADASYAGLRNELVDTENRIALARTFYNNSVNALHDRAATLTGGVLSWVFELDLVVPFVEERERRLQAQRGAGAARRPSPPVPPMAGPSPA